MVMVAQNCSAAEQEHQVSALSATPQKQLGYSHQGSTLCRAARSAAHRRHWRRIKAL